MVAPLIMTKTVVLGKKESVYNTDPTPTNVADALLPSAVDISFPTQNFDRPVVTADLSKYAPIHGRKYAQISFSTEIKGSGVAGTAPDWGRFLECCGFGETIVASTSVTYAPISASIPSLTLHVYKDGKLFVVTGARGNAKFRFPVGEPAMIDFVFTGHPVDDQDSAVPTPTLDSTAPLSVKGTSFTINSFAGVIAALELDMANEVVIPDSVVDASGYGEVTIVDRNPSGNINPEATLVADHDYWSEWEDDTQMALSIALTGSAGNISTFTAPKLVYRELKVSEREKIMIYDATFSAARNSGNDEASLAMT